MVILVYSYTVYKHYITIVVRLISQLDFTMVIPVTSRKSCTITIWGNLGWDSKSQVQTHFYLYIGKLQKLTTEKI